MSKKTVYAVIGVPGSGKSWVCEQLKDVYHYVAHDAHIDKAQPGKYLNAILKAINSSDKPVLIDIPFSMSAIMEPLLRHNCNAVPVFISETKQIVSDRYTAREGKPIPTGHLTRIDTFNNRAKEMKAFAGTSEAVLNHLKDQNKPK